MCVIFVSLDGKYLGSCLLSPGESCLPACFSDEFLTFNTTLLEFCSSWNDVLQESANAAIIFGTDDNWRFAF